MTLIRYLGREWSINEITNHITIIHEVNGSQFQLMLTTN